MDDLISIGRFSTITRLSLRMLRHYDELGLLRPAWVDPGSGYRYYRHEQAPVAETIRLLRALDMPLHEIRTLLDGDDPASVSARLTAFREHVAHELTETQRTLAYVEQLIARIESGEALVDIQVQVSDLPARTIVGRRARVRPDALGRWIGASFGIVGAYFRERGGTMNGPPGTIYHGFGDEADLIDVEAFAPLTAPIASSDAVACRQLVHGPAATTIHTGPYETIASAYVALSAWVQRSGHEVDGPPREEYLTDPDETPDPNDYMTRVIWAIRT